MVKTIKSTVDFEEVNEDMKKTLLQGVITNMALSGIESYDAVKAKFDMIGLVLLTKTEFKSSQVHKALQYDDLIENMKIIFTEMSTNNEQKLIILKDLLLKHIGNV